MDDQELRGRLDGLDEGVARVEDAAKELRQVLTMMQVSDAESRADVKVVVGKLDNAAVALANAAQSIQARELAGQKQDEVSPHEKWMLRIIVGLLAAILGLAGIRTFDPAILKSLFGL